MRTDWVIPARYAELSGDGTMSILGAGIDTLLLPTGALPIPCEMFLAFRVAGTQDEWASERHVLSVALIFPSGRRQDVMRHERHAAIRVSRIGRRGRLRGLTFLEGALG